MGTIWLETWRTFDRPATEAPYSAMVWGVAGLHLATGLRGV